MIKSLIFPTILCDIYIVYRFGKFFVIKIFDGGISCPYYSFVHSVVQIEVGMPNDRTIKGNECENIRYEVYQLRLAGISIFEPYFVI